MQLLIQLVISWILMSIYSAFSSVSPDSYQENAEISGSHSIGLKPHHIVRRAAEETLSPFNHTFQCVTSGLPNPSPEFPAILFRDLNYNNCSSSGFYMKLRPGYYHKFSSNINDRRVRNIIYNSMLMIPGLNVSFKGCCPSGNDFRKQITDWQSTPDMNHSVYYKTDLSGTDGIWYTDWLYWDTSFYVKVDAQQDFSVGVPNCGVTCYFGQCGLANKCECAPGYSGSQCEIRPTSDSYPTQQYPLILFKNTNFEGAHVKVGPDSFRVFATNRESRRTYEFNSMRVLYNRSIVFSRNLVQPLTLSIGTDIEDLPTFFQGNSDIANPIWILYDLSMEADFYVKVNGNSNCDNCSTTTGSCYTGNCNCYAGFTGANCDVSI